MSVFANFFVCFGPIFVGLLCFGYKSSKQIFHHATTLLSVAIISLVVFLLFKLTYIGNSASAIDFKLPVYFFGMGLNFGLDIYSLIFIDLVGILWLPSSIYTVFYMKKVYPEKDISYFMLFFHLSIFFTFLVGLSRSLFSLFISYELLTLSTIPLVAFHNTQESRKALYKYLIILLGTSLLILFPTIIYIHFSTIRHIFETESFLFETYLGNISPLVILFLCVLGFSKTAIFPVHGWLPAAMVAPVPVSALLHSVAVVNVGLFCIFRILNNVIGLETLLFTPENNNILQYCLYNWLSFLSAFTIIFASFKAISQRELKSILAYSTISQLSYSMLVFATFSINGLLAGLIQMICHSLGKIILFFCVGYIYAIYGKKNIFEVNGLAKLEPIVFIAFVIGTLSLIGFPLTAGFISKWTIIESLHLQNYLFLFVIIFATVCTSIYTLPIIYRALFLKPDVNYKPVTSYPLLFVIVGVCALNLIAFGFYEAWNERIFFNNPDEIDLNAKNTDVAVTDESGQPIDYEE